MAVYVVYMYIHITIFFFVGVALRVLERISEMRKTNAMLREEEEEEDQFGCIFCSRGRQCAV